MTDEQILTLVWAVVSVLITLLVAVVGWSIFQTIRKDQQAQRDHEARMGKARGRRKA